MNTTHPNTVNDAPRAGRGAVATMDRRQLLKTAALVGGWSALAGTASGSFRQQPWADSGEPFPEYLLSQPENVLYSTCLQCHVRCQMKAKIWDGTLAKLTGSPYSPLNYLPHLPYATDLERAAVTDGKLCAKGQSGIQTYYDPYRVRRVLKRNGPRGSGKWIAIPFEQFIDEVVSGGRLFTSLGDDREYPGFDEVWALRDPTLAAGMAADAKAFGRGEMSLPAFQAKYREHLNTLIDPDHPDLGPRNNGFVFDAGRIQHGRKELMAWFTKQSLGSNNAFEHTTICEQSHHIAYGQMTGGDNNHMKPDLEHARFVLFWGTGAFSANFGLTPMAQKVTEGVSARGMKTAVVDPRLSNDAAKTDWWLPVMPGADGALALAMIRWILENERYDRRYLENANKAAAAQDGEPTWTDATHLVKIVDGEPRELLRASEAGVPGGDRPVVVRGGRLFAVDPDDTTRAVEGELFVSRTVRGHEVKSAFQLLKEEAYSHSFTEYEDITGVSAQQMAAVAGELTSHGKRAGVELYRGPVQHTDGFHAAAAIITLNLLIGNPDWKGGLSKGAGYWHEFGGREASVYNFGDMHPASQATFGPPITRERSKYEDYSLFREEGYPARRPWYPFTNNVYQEIIPSFAQGYPYPGKILFLHLGTPALSSPAGHKVIDMLRDPEHVPLFIACDIVIGETSMYADYIVPDLTYLERWGTPHVSPDIPTLTSKVRQPVAQPLTEDVEIDGERMPISLEAFLIAVAKKLGLPGFGRDGLGPGLNFDRPEDWYLKLVANMAFGDKAGEVVPDASETELAVFRSAHQHLPASVFDEERWKAALRPEEWRKVVYVLNRGGRFAPYDTGWDGSYMKRKMGKMFHLFMEAVAGQRNSISGRYFAGYPVYRGQFDAAGQSLSRDGEYPLTLITYKEPFGGQSRTISNYWSNIALLPENRILMNRQDAEHQGLRDEQLVRLESASNPTGTVDVGDGRVLDIVGRLQVLEGLRPGVVAVSWHYGHWAYGSNDVVIDGERIKGDRRRGTGLCPNPVMTVEPRLGDVCLTDPIGGSSSFYDTRVAVRRAG